MSSDVNRQNMIHAAVNTDPLQLTALSSVHKQLHYGLKERKIPHIKVAETNELSVWYDFGEKIGEGAFGLVMAVKEKNTCKNWAMKTVVKSTADAGHRLKMIEREVQILKLIQHPHIIYLDKIFESPRKVYMIFERCYGELAKIYNERKPFIEQTAKLIIKQLAEAVAYLHKYDIVHRDLKMENILIGENPIDPRDEYYIKLTDFGLSIVKCGQGIDSMLRDFCGTLFYMAPEIITLRSYSQQCDVWAIGVLLYMLILGKYPFFSKNEKELQDQICSRDPDFTEITPSSEAIDLILLLLTKNPANRISATEMLNHPWMLNRKMSRALQYNILQMMKEWKSEMKVPGGQESDWVSTKNIDLENSTVLKKQPLNLPKTNINFERPRKVSCNKQKIIDSEKEKRTSVTSWRRQSDAVSTSRIGNVGQFNKDRK